MIFGSFLFNMDEFFIYEFKRPLATSKAPKFCVWACLGEDSTAKDFTAELYLTTTKSKTHILWPVASD